MEQDRTPPTYAVARPRFLRTPLREQLIAILVLTLVSAGVALALGSIALGALLLLAAALLSAGVFEHRTWFTHARALAGLAVRSTRAWTGAGRDVLRLKLEERDLERRRRRLQYELGGAVLDGDARLVEDLRRRVRDCVEELARREESEARAVRRARAVTADERAAAARTQIMGDPGFEPGTSSLSETRSNQLS